MSSEEERTAALIADYVAKGGVVALIAFMILTLLAVPIALLLGVFP